MGDQLQVRIAVAQIEVSANIPDATAVTTARDRVIDAIRRAAEFEARVVCFPEGTLAYPSKRLMSRVAPELGEADWSRADWPAVEAAIEAIQREAALRGVWVVVGAPHQLSNGRRPHNSLYVISDAGDIVDRYDKRFISTNEAAYLYTPGTSPVVVEVDGVRFGFAVCLETLFPEIFVHYEQLGADVVHIASAPDPNFAMLAQAYAFATGLHISIAFGASTIPTATSGICAPFGWLARTDSCDADAAVADVAPAREAYTFQRRARSGELYEALYAVDDPRTRAKTQSLRTPSVAQKLET